MTHSYFKVVDQTLHFDLGEPLKTGDALVKEVTNELCKVQLPKAKVLKIDGRMTLLLSYVIAHGVAHLYRAVAVSYPRLDAHIVVISSHPDYPVGSRISYTGEVETMFSTSPSPFSYYWDKDSKILQTKLERGGIDMDGDEIVRNVFGQLNQSESQQLKGGSLLKINGRCPLPVGFVLANHFAHLYGAIAINDPKLATDDAEQYVVVISHSPNYSVGDKIAVASDRS